MKLGGPKHLASTVASAEYGRQLAAVADCLASFGLTLTEGTPTNLRRPAMIRKDAGHGPVVLVRVELDGALDEGGRAVVPPAIKTLADALGLNVGEDGVNARVLCIPRDWDSGSPLVRSALREADVEIAIEIDDNDVADGEADRRKLKIAVGSLMVKRRIAAWLEAHPFAYSFAAIAEFYVKHPLFGQVLCGGPCGISGAWQFTCTMGKSFTTKSQIEQNLLARPVFQQMRSDVRPHIRRLWRAWESVMCAALWPPIWLRRGIVWVAQRLPSEWFREARGIFHNAAITLFDHLECPKSLRNGACGATTFEGQCGELLKYGIAKPCVFYFRNTRDRRGLELAPRLVARAQLLRNRSGLLAPLAFVFEGVAAIVDRRRLSNRIYPRVDTSIPGASAIVSAMAGHYKGMTLFGSPTYLPRTIARSRIALIGRSERGRHVIWSARKRMKALPSKVGDRARTLAEILRALASESVGGRQPGAEPVQYSTYERVLAHEADARSPRTSRTAGSSV